MHTGIVLVTGGAGFIGSHLVDALIAQGYSVRVIDKLVAQVHTSGEPQYLNSKAEFVKADACDPAALLRALEGVDVVFHEAAEVGVGQSMYEIERYVGGNTFTTAVLLNALVNRRKKIRKLIVASSMSIYGEGSYQCAAHGIFNPQLRASDQLVQRRWEVSCPVCGREARPVLTREDKPLFPTSVYAITKYDQEALCLVTGRAYGIPTVALRYFNVYGSRQALSNPYTGVCAIFSSRLLKRQAPVIFEDGEQTRDFVHVSDIVQANIKALETNRGDYHALNIGTGVPTSVRRIAQLLANGLGQSVEPQLVGKYREGDIRHCVADITAARELLGYEPRVHIGDGVPHLLKWVHQQSAVDRIQVATEELEERQLIR